MNAEQYTISFLWRLSRSHHIHMQRAPSFFSINPHLQQQQPEEEGQAASPRSLSFDHHARVIADYFTANTAARAPIDAREIQEKLGVEDDAEFGRLLAHAAQQSCSSLEELGVYAREIERLAITRDPELCSEPLGRTVASEER
jgi:hypothetical protein